MALETLKLDLKEMGLSYLLANAAVEIGNYAKGRRRDLSCVFMTGEMLRELSNDEETLSGMDYIFREPLKKCYGEKWGIDIKTPQDLRKSLEEVSDDYRGFRQISDERRKKLEQFSLTLYERMLYFQGIDRIDFLSD